MSLLYSEKFTKYAEKELKKESSTSVNSQIHELQSYILDMEASFTDYLTGDCLRVLEVRNYHFSNNIYNWIYK